MSDATAWIAAGWLSAFTAVNAVLYAAWWRRTRDERTFLRGVRTADVDPIQAAWWLGAPWDGASPQREDYAAQVAVSLLLLAGDADIDRDGRITVPRGRLGTQKDPVLAALVTLLRRHKGATVHELLTDPRFGRFRKVLLSRRPPLRKWFGSYRFTALTASCVTAFGMSMHAMIMRCPVPGLPDLDPSLWTTAWIGLWALLAALAAAWPQEMSRPWPRFTRRCRTAVTRALAGQSPDTRHRVSVTSSKPSDRHPPAGAAGPKPRADARVAGRTPPRYDVGTSTESHSHHDGPDIGDFGGGSGDFGGGD
ncbi:hypothetical protein [Streptomyces sp. NPDC093094]|uniref:hypothetical protein n=1 Tax=Streptomyces sp. NPDC093094 TaxID=3366026 RepID=UPI00382E4C68